MLGKIEGSRKKWPQMMSWLDGIIEFDQTPGSSEGQGSLGCCSPWVREESYKTEQLNNITNKKKGWKRT